MRIFEHEIQSDQIIGIGPLLRTQAGLVAHRLVFDVYLFNYSITIESDPFRNNDFNDEKAREEYKQQYLRIEDIILKKISDKNIAPEYLGPR